jgi:hypothetical protein
VVNLSRIRSKADLIGALNPKAIDGLKPHYQFVFSNAHVELMVADAVKSIAGAIADKGLAKEVMELSRTMAKSATSGIVSSWEPGDEICPPWPWPWPWFNVVEPDPSPLTQISAASQLELAHVLTQVSGLTTSKEFNAALKTSATKLAGVAVSTMLDEFEKCGTVPRKPFGPRH